MKSFFVLLFLNVLTAPAFAQGDLWSYINDEQHPGKETYININEEAQALFPSFLPEGEDPFETVNRGIFSFNEVLDMVFMDPISNMYKDLVPEFLRERVGYALRNLGEPVVFINNVLQGELEDARVTVWRFVINSTLGGAGLFDVSTDLGFSYRRQDFGLTLARWGADVGPYLVLPILGPCTWRDAFGRLGDYAFDPINWWAYTKHKDEYSYARTGAQILDARTSNLELLDDLKRNSLDYYATIRTWYQERRRDLMLRTNERQALDTPRPDDDDEL